MGMFRLVRFAEINKKPCHRKKKLLGKSTERMLTKSPIGLVKALMKKSKKRWPLLRFMNSRPAALARGICAKKDRKSTDCRTHGWRFTLRSRKDCRTKKRKKNGQ